MRQHLAFIAATMAALLAFTAVSAHDIDHPAVKVRVTGFDPATDTYHFSCEIPPSVPGSQIEQRRFYAIDPVPVGHNRSFHSTSGNFSWDLHPTDYDELVHEKAIYHVYCEVQNYSAPPGEQNMASEFHVDLRTDDNEDVPDIYVLSSMGNSITLKCEPPDNVSSYDLSWAYRSRQGRVDLPALKNQRIVNITLPQAGSGWDVVCSVFDRTTGRISTWDMPLETFEGRPAYVPTIEGCVVGEPCTWVHASGIPPPGALQLSTEPHASVYINEVLKGTTSSSGAFALDGITPGVYNLVLRKEGLAELSTLVPIASGKTAARNYTMQLPMPPPDPWNTCHATVYSLPVNCTGGSITADDAGGCRTITCAGGANSLSVQACNKPGNTNPTHFELSRKSSTGSGVRICVGDLCLQNEGFLRSNGFPICLGNGTNGTPSCTPSAETCNQRDDDCDGQIDEGDACTPIPPNITCAYGNQTYQANQTFPAGDGCNTCTCTGNGTVACTQQACAPNATTTCYASLNTLPTNCTGTITSDVKSSGRTISCTGTSGNVQVQAWEKTDAQGRFFEINRQSGSGTAPTVCIGKDCLKPGWGYQKGSLFPICIGNQTETPLNSSICSYNGTTYTTNQSFPAGDGCNTCTCTSSGTVTCTQQACTPPNATCHNTVKDITATCTGSITQDAASGTCRTIQCAEGGGTIKVFACDKPDSGTKRYFEMYRQSFNGTPPKVCIGQLCIQNEGYKRSTEYPICA